MKLNDTIAAVSTPPGRGGIGIVRLSGPSAFEISSRIIAVKVTPAARHAMRGELLDRENRLIDEVLVTHFPAPKSYTAENVVEISCHGAPVILRHCLDRAVDAGARLAEPGEFTLRAFLNGRLDLPQAEAVGDLIEATTLYQARIAAQQTQGSVSRRLLPIKAQLLELIALLEAGIDFAEDDISVAPAKEILRRLDPILHGAKALADSYRYGNVVRHGFSLAIVGPPNAGKSSLFNCLLQQDRAIVTPVPGTTRDLVSETISFEGIPVRLVDTAGIRDTAEMIERLGIERSYEAMSDADLTLVVIDGSIPFTHDQEQLLAKAREQGRYLLVANKSDSEGFRNPPGSIPVSAISGQGIDALRESIMNHVAPRGALELDGGFITSLRQEKHLRDAATMLGKARAATQEGLPHELLLLDLYCALSSLDSLTGITNADDILNNIFANFCIGK